MTNDQWPAVATNVTIPGAFAWTDPPSGSSSLTVDRLCDTVKSGYVEHEKMLSELIHTFDYTVDFIEQSVADLAESQMVEQPENAPNHATWTLGHVIFSCQEIAAELGAERWLPDDWEARFGYGSAPSSDPSRYPGKAEMLSLLAAAASRLRQTLRGADDAVLRQPLPDESIPTMVHLLMQVVVAHTAYHAGQLAVWRRAIGKAPVGVFI